jgi:hypothetical protein
MTDFDPVQYKRTTEQQCQDAADAWHRWGPALHAWLGPATELMLDMAGIGPGSRVLDVAAGAGTKSRRHSRGSMVRATSRARARCSLEGELVDAHTTRPDLRAGPLGSQPHPEGVTQMTKTILALTLAAAMTVAAELDVAATHSPGAVVLKWNQLLQSTLPQPGNPLTPRFYAMTHIAMFDAVNAIERDFEPYRVRLRPGLGGSSHAAAAQAAHDVLVALNPSAAPAYDEALAADLGDRPSGFLRRGAAIGAHVAKEILAWRQQDGWVVPAFPPYAEPPLPGRWQPTPPANAAATFTHLREAAPMALLSATQVLPQAPPSLTSARYAADLNEVKLLGKSDSAVRTEEQTLIARLWSGVGTTTGFFSVWNNVARDVILARQLSLVDAARVFVLVNVSIHDALQTTQASKFVYGVWRPVTAIRAAETDLNAETDPDSTWEPLIVTPPYPSYAGNLATIGASAARALQLVSDTNDVPVAITWSLPGGLPGVTRHYDGFWQAADEEALARIYGGVHYRFDQQAGLQVGVSVAEYVFANVVRPRSRSLD